MIERTDHAGRSVLVRWLFLRLLALVHLVAFGSIWLQITALVGDDGIAPSHALLERAMGWFEREQMGFAWWKVPTVFWLGTSDNALNLVCGGGIAASLLLFLGFAPVVLLLALWALYLSICTIGDVFLGYQWDALLLETTLMAAFIAPWGLWPRLRNAVEPPALAMWLPRLLLFKLMFSSGVVKVGQPGEWLDRTALDYHYWTQPLPHLAAWYVHQLPPWVHRASVSITLAIELIGPFLIFLGPRRWRLWLYLALVAGAVAFVGGAPGPVLVAFLVALALLLDERVMRGMLPPEKRAADTSRFGAFALFVLLLGSITATGNYGFFTLLSLVLCVSLLDDAGLRRLLPGRLRERWSPPAQILPSSTWAAVFAGLFATLWVPASLLRMSTLLPRAQQEGRIVELREPVLRALAPYDSVNGYGLFARMTTERAEVLVEGSADGESWKPYTFLWKPVDPTQAPAWAAFHMPRLDWQLWFAGLAGTCQRAPWFLQYARRLLQNEPGVLALMRDNPFPNEPPQFVRARLAQYSFTTPAEREATGRWWNVRSDGEFCPAVSLEMLERL